MITRIAISLCALFCAFPAFAAEEGTPPIHTQQEKFTQCAHESHGLKGEERHQFMSECLKSHAPDKEARADPVRQSRDGAPGHEQQNRMRTCNEQARSKDLHGDDRRAFMSACLKG